MSGKSLPLSLSPVSGSSFGVFSGGDAGEEAGGCGDCSGPVPLLSGDVGGESGELSLALSDCSFGPVPVLSGDVGGDFEDLLLMLSGEPSEVSVCESSFEEAGEGVP